MCSAGKKIFLFVYILSGCRYCVCVKLVFDKLVLGFYFLIKRLLECCGFFLFLLWVLKTKSCDPLFSFLYA